MTIDLQLLASIALGLASTYATWRLFDWWLEKPAFRELTRYTDNALAGYEARRDALAEVDPDFLTDYARRLASWEQKKKNPSAA